MRARCDEEALVPYVDTNDIADVVVEALLDDRHGGQIYELTGPRQWTFPQVMQEISTVTGRDITFTPITMDEYQKMLREFDVPEDYIWLINYLFTEVLVSSNSVVTDDIQKVLGREPTDFAEYVRTTADSGIWNPVPQDETEGVKEAEVAI